MYILYRTEQSRTQIWVCRALSRPGASPFGLGNGQGRGGGGARSAHILNGCSNNNNNDIHHSVVNRAVGEATFEHNILMAVK